METTTTEKLLSDQLKGLDALIRSISDDVDAQQLCTHFLDAAVAGLADIQASVPSETHQQVSDVVLKFASLATCLSAHFARRSEMHEELRRRGVEVRNAEHELVVEVAQAKALKEWESDVGKKIRVNGMAEIIWKSMIDSGFQDYLPDSSSGLAKWLKPVAPDYASKPGRPKKSI